jgi:hypothetical protein
MQARLLKSWSGSLILCLALGACDRGADPAQAPVAASRVSKSAHNSSTDPLANMVKAVSSDTRHQAFDLRFELTGRPQVGEAVEVKLMLQAIDDATGVTLTISADPKLAIVAGGEATFASIKAGETVAHTMTLRPTGTGIIVINANLAANSNGGPHTVNYAIPIAVTEAVSQSSASSAATTSAAHK